MKVSTRVHYGLRAMTELARSYRNEGLLSIAEIARKLLGTKIILLVRDPVSRAWSHTSMWQRGGNLPEGTLDSAQSYRAFLESPGSLGGEHFPTRVATRWQEQAPNLSFRYFLFDDLARDPEGTRHDILCYLGADPAKASGELSADYNAKTKKQKLDLAPADGEHLGALIKKIYATPKPIVAKIGELIK